jgi:hypothetical protein
MNSLKRRGACRNGRLYVIGTAHQGTARELGLPVRNDMPENVLHLMQLYPQPTRRQPFVEYLPVRYPPRRAGSQAGN